MKIRVYLDENTTEVFTYQTDTELYTAIRNFEHYDFNWEFV